MNLQQQQQARLAPIESGSESRNRKREQNSVCTQKNVESGIKRATTVAAKRVSLRSKERKRHNKDNNFYSYLIDIHDAILI